MIIIQAVSLLSFLIKEKVDECLRPEVNATN
jgi:hypothetical protein